MIFGIRGEMPRVYLKDGPHPLGYRIDNVPLHIVLTMHPLRTTFEADPREGKAKREGDYVISDYVFQNWAKMVDKFKTLSRWGPTDGFPVLLDGVTMGMNEAGRLLKMHPATLRRKFEKGIVEIRGHSFWPDEVVLDFCYEQVQNEKRRKKERSKLT